MINFLRLFFAFCSFGAMAMDEPPRGQEIIAVEWIEKENEKFRDEKLIYKIETQLVNKFPGKWNCLDLKKLALAIFSVPARKKNWNSAVFQRAYLLILNSNDPAGAAPLTDSDIFDLIHSDLAQLKIPPSLEPCICSMLAPFGRSLRGFSRDKDGSLFFGPTPKKLINEHMHHHICGDLIPALASEKTMSPLQLIDAVEENISKGMPTICYCVDDSEAEAMCILSIVGLNEEKNKFMVLDTKGNGADRVKEVSVESFLAKMNLLPVMENLLSILSLIMTDICPRPLPHGITERFPDQNLLMPYADTLYAKLSREGLIYRPDMMFWGWRPYSFITWLSKDDLKKGCLFGIGILASTPHGCAQQ